MATSDEDRKRAQRESWNAAAAGWEKWWSTFERAAQCVSDRLVALAHLKPGDRVLDIATGTGEPAITAARVVGKSGHVLAIDQSPGMLAAARRRADALALSNVEYREGDAESLAIAERNFDAILCRWGLMFVPDVDKAIRGIHGLLKPGGWLATAVWDSGENVPMITMAAKKIREIVNLPPPPPDAISPMRLADTSILERAAKAAGFRDFSVEPIIVNFDFDSPESFLQMRRDISYDFRMMVANQPADVRSRIEQAILDEARTFVGADGKMRTRNRSLLIAARA
jgi:ubiquinone/menaquinone biosynthesis C-methylase UbiE